MKSFLVSSLLIVALVAALYVGVGVLLAPTAAPMDDALASTLPHVILFSIDTLRADHVSAYGYHRETTPVLDRLAATRGVLFERAYSHSPKTAPSHMSMLTGLLPLAHGVTQPQNGDPQRGLSPDVPTLATILGRSGYRTVAVTEGGNARPQLGFAQGMDRFAVHGGLDKVLRHVTGRIVEMLESSATRRPFFYFIHTYEVHAPYTPSEPYRSMFTDPGYDGDIVGDRAEIERRTGGDWGAVHSLFWDAVDAEDARDVQHLRDLYDGSIREVDAMVGRLLDELDRLGIGDQTLFIVVSDHGEEFNEHGRFRHHSVHQNLLHVPWIMVFPGERGEAYRGRREHAVVRLIDLAPTVLDYLELPIPSHFQGTSLLPLLDVGRAPPAVVKSSWPSAGMHALRERSWKLVEHERGRPGHTRELFEIDADPEETEDRARSEPEAMQGLIEKVTEIDAGSRAIADGLRPGNSVRPSGSVLERLRALGYAQ